MTGVAWLIPYSARHHPLHLKEYGCRGSACSPLSGQEGRRPQTARVITRCMLNSNGYPAHHPPLPGTINPVCAMPEHGGLAWPPRHPALRQTRLLLSEAFTLTIFGSAFCCFRSLLATPAAGPDFSGERLEPFRQLQVF